MILEGFAVAFVGVVHLFVTLYIPLLNLHRNSYVLAGVVLPLKMGIQKLTIQFGLEEVVLPLKMGIQKIPSKFGLAKVVISLKIWIQKLQETLVWQEVVLPLKMMNQMLTKKFYTCRSAAT